jgi:NAD(P)-dependent dehydrogenase (short-subunit alcohol dehydrogenase family)
LNHPLSREIEIEPAAAKLGAMTEADFDEVMGTNLEGMFLPVSACLPAGFP